LAFEAGIRLGPFEILGSLGAGGMGEVWRARHTKLGREVAIKTLPEEFAADPDRLARFEREAQTTSNLNHPNILTIFDVGEVDGRPYLAAELVPGETLRARLTQSTTGRLAVADVVDFARQVASALAAAHDAGIVHRDLKPENVMIRPDGLVKLLDFGLAKAVLAPTQPGEGSALDTLARTAIGAVVGTVAYMSPEQARGFGVDARSDVFSLGAVLYEMLAGRAPFTGPSQADVLVAILDRVPAPLDAARPDTPPALQAVVARCLEKDPARRYRSGRDLLAALDEVAASPSVASPSSPSTGPARARTSAAPPSVAVLPFANMSANPDDEYFCDGIAEEITSALARVEQVNVAGRTSAFSFKGKASDLREIGRTLNVSAVLEGSVRRAGNRLRITAQLVKVADGYHVWSERYDRQMDDIFEIQDEIALAVVEALKVTLLGKEKAAVLKRSTENPAAYRLCLKAYHAWARWTDEGFRTAIKLFEEALSCDPDYAMARFGLGDCHASRSILGRDRPDHAKARTELETAIRLDPSLADAHAVLGLVEGMYEWNWASAESRFEKAIALDPRSPHICNVYGLTLGITGRHDQAVATYRRAIELDPLGPLWNACFAQILLAGRNWDAVLRQARTTLELVPDYWFALQIAGQAWLASGHFAEAITMFERAVVASAEVPYTIGLLGNAMARAGHRDQALEQLARLQSGAGYVPALALAFVHAGLDQHDEAFGLMERAIEDHEAWLSQSLSVNATLDPLRSDPRFEALRGRIGLPDR
jgi:serine/threonine protein kinase/tetratricopeptide (TPR) repeat protein